MFRSLFYFACWALLSLPHLSAATQDLDPAVVQESVRKLSDIGVITDAQYWLENAQVGKVLPSSSMNELLIAAAGKFETVNSPEEAIAVLNRQKILNDLERWKHQLLDKSSFPGADAAFLIILFAKKIN